MVVIKALIVDISSSTVALRWLQALVR